MGWYTNGKNIIFALTVSSPELSDAVFIMPGCKWDMSPNGQFHELEVLGNSLQNRDLNGPFFDNTLEGGLW